MLPISRSLAAALILGTALPGASSASTPARAAVSTHAYAVTGSIPLGEPDRWDYLTFDPDSGRLYAAHSTRIDVIDIARGAVIGRVPVPGANGVALVTAHGKGYAGSRGQKSVLVFDLDSLKVSKTLPAAEDTDGVIYDPASHRVFVVEGDPAAATVIDTESDEVIQQMPLGGRPEFAVADGAGHLYVNITDKHEIARVDTKALRVDARWPMPGCMTPRGLAIDISENRLFSTCANAKMIIVDAGSGQIVSMLPIGKGSDAAAFDPARKLAFSSNGEGTITVVRQNASRNYEVVDTVPTQPLARTMAVDPGTGRLFVICADALENSGNRSARAALRPGSARVLVLEPVR